jgi:hypothetical protein
VFKVHVFGGQCSILINRFSSFPIAPHGKLQAHFSATTLNNDLSVRNEAKKISGPKAAF